MSVQEKWVGCFRTCCLSHILNMFNGYKRSSEYKSYENIEIVKLTASRGKELHKDVIRPYSYLTIENIESKHGYLEYDWMRHGKLNIRGVLRALKNSGIEEMVVENVSFLMPKEWVLSDGEIIKEEISLLDRGKAVVATFENTFIEAWMDGQLRRQVEEIMGDQIRDYRFKHSVLDLTGVSDARSWARGVRNQYNLETNPNILWRVLYHLDPDGDLRRFRQYRLEEGRYWRLVKITSTI